MRANFDSRQRILIYYLGFVYGYQWEQKGYAISFSFNYPLSLSLPLTLALHNFFLSLCPPTLLPRHLELDLPRLQVCDTSA